MLYYNVQRNTQANTPPRAVFHADLSRKRGDLRARDASTHGNISASYSQRHHVFVLCAALVTEKAGPGINRLSGAWHLARHILRCCCMFSSTYRLVNPPSQLPHRKALNPSRDKNATHEPQWGGGRRARAVTLDQSYNYYCSFQRRRFIGLCAALVMEKTGSEKSRPGGGGDAYGLYFHYKLP